jgi:hypothetical protein
LGLSLSLLRQVILSPKMAPQGEANIPAQSRQRENDRSLTPLSNDKPKATPLN